MRDYRKLRVFEAADTLVKAIYVATKQWPSEERFGLTAQIRRASVSIASNIVEGCARSTQREYCRYLEIAFASANEVSYQLSLANHLEMNVGNLEALASDCCKMLYGLVRANSERPESREPKAES